MANNFWLNRAEAIKEDIRKWRRDLHQMPETGISTPMTAEYVQRQLEAMGITCQTYGGHSGISAVIGPRDKKCVALRADMDGLPIQEQTGLPYASKNGNMHACGHDGHTAMVLGAAKLLKEYEDQLPGCVKLIFEAGEEAGNGGKLFVESGVLKNPDVQAMFSMHVEASSEEYKLGDMVIWKGTTHASNDNFYLTITGTGGHGGRPYSARDPIAAAAQLINQFQSFVSRETDPNAPVVISVCEVRAGNGAVNIIPDKAVLNGTIRTSNPAVRAQTLERFEEIVRGICMAARTEFDLRFEHGEPAVINDEQLRRILLENAVELLGPEFVHELQGHNMGSEDIGFFFEKVPGSMFRFCVMKPDENGIVWPLHNAKMDIDDSLLYRGTALLAASAVQYLKD